MASRSRISPRPRLTYTNFAGKQCALPSLTDAYGLYYNKQMFKDAGIASPPKTMDELMADAKKLTVRNSDGSIKVADSSRWISLGSWERPISPGPGMPSGSTPTTRPSLPPTLVGRRPSNWQKQLIDFYGYDNIAKFASGYTASEFNPSNMFENGKIAMVFDGEWRTAFIGRDVPKFGYDTVPFPAADSSVYGSGRVGGTVVAFPRRPASAIRHGSWSTICPPTPTTW